MDQGFGWFRERPHAEHDLARTLDEAREFLRRDDGRPVFLFVHTYRVHAPYRQGVDEDQGANRDLLARVERHVLARAGKGRNLAQLRNLADEYHDLYLDGVRALDQAFGGFLAWLEDGGVLAPGHLVFTSDHGEEFFEHGGRWHRRAPHEEKVRVPLFFHGPGLTPRDVLLGASLIDVAPTLAQLAGVPLLESWEGRSLLTLGVERPLLLYNERSDQRYFAIVRGERKIFARSVDDLTSGTPQEAYDLHTDPGEARNLMGEGPAWAAELARSLPWVRGPAQEGVAAPAEVQLSPEALEELRRLGYAE